MASVWRAELSVDSVAFSLPAPAAFAGSSPINMAAMALTAYSGTDPFGQHSWGIRFGVRFHSYGAGPSYEYQAYAECIHLATGINSAGEPFGSYGVIHTILEANGNAGGGFQTGGTIAIEKDQASDQIRFLTPIGNFTDTLSTYESSTEALRPMKPYEMGMMVFYQGTADTYNLDLQFFGFWGKQDGTKFRGAPLSAAQAGSFGAWTVDSTNFGGPFIHSTATQQTIREEGRLYWALTDPVQASQVTAYTRIWNGGDTIPVLPLNVDLHNLRHHGVVFAAYSKIASNDTIYTQYSYDNGLNWTESVIAQGMGWVVDSITISSHGDTLWAVWSDGKKIRQAFSTSWGIYWSAPITLFTSISLPVKNLYPRLLIDPWHGLQYYFYVDNVGLKLLRDADFGLAPLDTSGGFPVPINVFSGLVNIQVDAAVFLDGTLEVRWNDGAVTEILRSTNFGKTWTVYQSFATTLTWSRHVVDFDLGLYHFIDFIGTDINFHTSEDGGITFLIGGGATVVTGVGPQQPDVEKLADGRLLVAYFDPTLGTLIYKTSRDIGRHWV